jgi:glycerol transport system ATP-binding protein
VRLALERVATRTRGQPGLHRTSLILDPGLTVLLGPTLAGKTTLMRLMAGLERPVEGRVLTDGRDATGLPVRRRSVAMVYQQFVNYPSLTVFDNIASPLRVARRPAAEVDRRVREVAGLLRIEHLLDRLPAELSGGQQQRCAIGRALARRADLLLLDEPLVNLDYKLREELRAELAAVFARREAVVVYATTEPHEALLLGGRVAVLGEGRLLQAGPTLEVYHRPASTAVARIFGDPPMNLMPGEVLAGETGGVRLGAGTGAGFAPPPHLAPLAPGPYSFGVRANHLRVARRSSAEVALPARVALAEVNGSETFIHASPVDATGGADGVVADIVVQEEGIHTPALGTPVTVHLDPVQLYAFHPGGELAAAPARPGGG